MDRDNIKNTIVKETIKRIKCYPDGDVEEVPKYIPLFLSFNEAMYLQKILKETATFVPATIKWPLENELHFEIGSLQDLETFQTVPFKKDICRDMLSSMAATLHASVCEFLDFDPYNQDNRRGSKLPTIIPKGRN